MINHEFALNLRIEKPQEYPHYVDWSLKILRALGRVYNTNMSEITVRHINHTSEPVVFVWSNDSLATNVCERGEIEELFKVSVDGFVRCLVNSQFSGVDCQRSR